jgi:hypothetical protein
MGQYRALSTVVTQGWWSSPHVQHCQSQCQKKEMQRSMHWLLQLLARSDEPFVFICHWPKQEQRPTYHEQRVHLPCAWKEKEPEDMWPLMATTGQNHIITETKVNGSPMKERKRTSYYALCVPIMGESDLVRRSESHPTLCLPSLQTGLRLTRWVGLPSWERREEHSRQRNRCGSRV